MDNLGVKVFVYAAGIEIPVSGEFFDILRNIFQRTFITMAKLGK